MDEKTLKRAVRGSVRYQVARAIVFMLLILLLFFFFNLGEAGSLADKAAALVDRISGN